MDIAAANDLVGKFGFTARRVPLSAWGGFFLAPVSQDRFGHRHVGDDVMLVKWTSENEAEVVPYAHDAQAFLAATALCEAMSR